MKNKNVLFAVLGIIVLVVLVIGVFYHFRDRRTYTLNLPQLEKLESISLNQNEKDISINDREEMKDILYVLNGTKRVTKNESIQDAPINIDDEIKVDFHFIEAGVSTIFVYKKNINAINFYKKNDFIITSENIDKDPAEIEYTMTWNK